jgi:hypothetical protein
MKRKSFNESLSVLLNQSERCYRALAPTLSLCPTCELGSGSKLLWYRRKYHLTERVEVEVSRAFDTCDAEDLSA